MFNCNHFLQFLGKILPLISEKIPCVLGNRFIRVIQGGEEPSFLQLLGKILPLIFEKRPCSLGNIFVWVI